MGNPLTYDNWKNTLSKATKNNKPIQNDKNILFHSDNFDFTIDGIQSKIKRKKYGEQ